MKNLFLVIGLSMMILASCTPLKRTQTGLARGIAGSEVIHVNGHEVYCSEGKVCAEVEVLAIGVNDNSGRVQVTLKNRTGNTALIKIRLQIKDANTGEIVTETRAENVAIPATQEKLYEMPGVYRQGLVVRVLLNTAH